MGVNARTEAKACLYTGRVAEVAHRGGKRGRPREKRTRHAGDRGTFEPRQAGDRGAFESQHRE